MPAGIAELERIAPCQLGERFWKVAGSWHGCTPNENRDHSDIPFQARLHLHTHKVIRVVQPSLLCGIRNTEPPFADNDHQDVTFTDGILDDFDKVDPRLK